MVKNLVGNTRIRLDGTRLRTRYFDENKPVQQRMSAPTRVSSEGEFDQPSAQGAGRAQKNRSKRFYNVLFVSLGDLARARIGGALLNRMRGGDKYRVFVATAGRRAQSDLDLESEIDELLRKANLNGDSIVEVLPLNSPPMDFVIIFDDNSTSETSASWPGYPDVMRWHIARPSYDGKQEERERSFRRMLCELETRLNLFMLVCEKSERE